MRQFTFAFSLFLFISLSLVSASVHAEKAIIAVASNFTKTIEVVNDAFKEQYPQHNIRFSFGPTGKLFAQIKNGAPYDAFFAADEKRAKLAIKANKAVAESYFIYAQGKLVLFSETLPVASQPLQVLKNAEFRFLAMANPKTAPYGERAQSILLQNNLYTGLKTKIAKGESVAHAFQYVATKNAPIGFIALSQVVDEQSPLYSKGEYWLIPQQQYKPINQAAVVTLRGRDNQAVLDFMEFMQSKTAQQIIKQYGYGVL